MPPRDAVGSLPTEQPRRSSPAGRSWRPAPHTDSRCQKSPFGPSLVPLIPVSRRPDSNRLRAPDGIFRGAYIRKRAEFKCVRVVNEESRSFGSSGRDAKGGSPALRRATPNQAASVSPVTIFFALETAPAGSALVIAMRRDFLSSGTSRTRSMSSVPLRNVAPRDPHVVGELESTFERPGRDTAMQVAHSVVLVAALADDGKNALALLEVQIFRRETGKSDRNSVRVLTRHLDVVGRVVGNRLGSLGVCLEKAGQAVRIRSWSGTGARNQRSSWLHILLLKQYARFVSARSDHPIRPAGPEFGIRQR